MTAVLVCLGLATLVVVVGLRPHGIGPALGASAAVALAALGGAVDLGDLSAAAIAQWRAFVILASVMTMTAAAEAVGLLERLAARIEAWTRGPVRHAYAVTFVIAVLAATVLSNDAAILLLTPTVLALLRTVYPKRNPKFLVPFAFAIFAGAGVAPLVISNPMNLVFADQVGLDFNRYALVMFPVALVGWVVTFLGLRWCFRAELADEAPALGVWPGPARAVDTRGRIVLLALALVLAAYPLASWLGLPIWPIAGLGAVACLAVAGPRVARGVSWSIFPFLFGVFLLALAFERIGVVEQLATLYGASSSPLLAIGTVSAAGSALLNNHPMSVLNALTLEHLGASDAGAFAALVGGDLGPRLLPVGSLAALLWFDVLRRHGVEVRLGQFVRVGIVTTVPTLAVSLLALALLT